MVDLFDMQDEVVARLADGAKRTIDRGRGAARERVAASRTHLTYISRVHIGSIRD